MENIVDLLPDIIYLCDLTEQRTLYVNQAVTGILGYAVAHIRAMDRPLPHALIHGEDRGEIDTHRSLVMTSTEGRFLSCTCRVRHVNGSWRTLMIRERLVRCTADSQCIQVLGIAQDVTGHQRTEQILRNALEYKDTFLQEMHHRVKNNLQFLSNLFHLQNKAFLNPTDQLIFQDAQQRIQAIALAHDLLLPTNERLCINMGNYLARVLAPLHDPHLRRIAITFTVADEIPAIPMTRAVPCGLIASELVTNAIKHAFPANRQGTIRITLQFRQPDTVLLTVSDDGIGLPPDPELQQTTRQGMKLVHMFVRQLQGDIQIERGAGTQVMVSFTVESASHA